MTQPHNHRSETPIPSQVPSQGRDEMWRGRETGVRQLILAYLRERPGATVREVGDAVGLRSSSSAFYQLAVLEEKGLIKREKCPTCDAKIWTMNGEVIHAEDSG